ncbi:MAG: FAD-dependent oxidoreductase [Acidimicrobiales bacterium]
MADKIGEIGSFPHLFSPLRVGNIELKNRIVNSAHQTGFAAKGGFTSRLLAYHRERARGGAALLISQATCVTPEYLDLWNADDSIIEQYQAVARDVGGYGAHYFAELWHPGRQSEYTGTGSEIYLAPSSIPFRPFGRTWRVPHEIDTVTIKSIIAAFASAARRCQLGELSGVVLHFAHGNLVEQFMSPKTNHRTDEWGGSLDNRLRLAHEILHAVRGVVGHKLVVGARITAAGLDAGEPDHLDMLEIAGLIDSWKMLDYISVTMGHYSDAMNATRNVPNMTFPPGVWAKYGRGMKHVVSVPVFLVGRINHPQVAEELLSNGSCDAVAMARALIADPQFPAKVARGEVAEVRPCVGAMNCVDHLNRGGSVRCIHNPVVGHEETWGEELTPASHRLRVVVVGAGPAGLETSRVAAARGHMVTLLERSKQPGGQIRIASQIPGRSELYQIAEWLGAQCRRSEVDVRLDTIASVELLEEMHPDVVVLATGSRTPGVSAPSMDITQVDPWSVLDGSADLGGHVVVVDEVGDWQGIGVALAAAEQGACVDFVTPATYPGETLEFSNWRVAYEHLTHLGVTFHAISQFCAGARSEVTIRHGFGRREFVIGEVDQLVIVPFPVADDALYKELCLAWPERTVQLALIGDARAPRGIEQATFEGHKLGREL